MGHHAAPAAQHVYEAPIADFPDTPVLGKKRQMRMWAPSTYAIQYCFKIQSASMAMGNMRLEPSA